MVVGAIFVGADFEVLGSNEGVYGFQTPQANNHAYLGWSDCFPVIPKEGVPDLWVTFGSRPWSVLQVG